MFRIESYLKKVIRTALEQLSFPAVEITLQKPKVEAHGDLSTNIAMQIAGRVGQSPEQVARQITSRLSPDRRWIEKMETAGPGFINFFYAPQLLHQTVSDILQEKQKFGRSDPGEGKTAQVEFVSANPTGPLTIGHGRQAVLGDTIANLLEWCGYQVSREYYFNNAGRQMRVLGESVRQRYLQLLNPELDFPKDYYQGEYIIEIAKTLQEEYKGALKDSEDIDLFKSRAEERIFSDIKKTLARLGVFFDTFFNEKDLYENGSIDRLIRYLKEKGFAYEKQGALWFRSTALGLEQDRVIVKGSGEPTYRLPDIAYHHTKFERGFDLMVDLFGADHIATYPDVLAGLRALGHDDSRVKVLIHQFVTLYQGTEKIKMSTRQANFVTLNELLDEAGVDVTRWFFLMRSMDSHLNFDLTLAKTQSEENPVYYNQYAHARICSILRNAEENNFQMGNTGELDRLQHAGELQLMKTLMEFPGVIERCATDFSPHLLTQYLSEVSTAFHKFYTECRVLSEDESLSRQRLALCLATRTVLANGLGILGISAPERM